MWLSLITSHFQICMWHSNYMTHIGDEKLVVSSSFVKPFSTWLRGLQVNHIFLAYYWMNATHVKVMKYLLATLSPVTMCVIYIWFFIFFLLDESPTIKYVNNNLSICNQTKFTDVIMYILSLYALSLQLDINFIVLLLFHFFYSEFSGKMCGITYTNTHMLWANQCGNKEECDDIGDLIFASRSAHIWVRHKTIYDGLNAHSCRISSFRIGAWNLWDFRIQIIVETG